MAGTILDQYGNQPRCGWAVAVGRRRRCHRLARHLIPISKVNTSPTSDKTLIVIG
jgi:hypothetical protein